MSRSARLLDLIQLFRRHRLPVSGAAIAAELEISLRTLYRDIATLQSQGAPIDGAPGLGYVMREGFVLPPLMFSPDEVDALVLGTRWVASRGDARLAVAARDALAKIAAVLPPQPRRELETAALLAGPCDTPPVPASPHDAHLAALRQAIRREHKLVMAYRDAAGAETLRTTWPFALGYFDRTQVVVAWCELRGATRHFRTDRIARLDATGERYPRGRQALLAEWRVAEGVQDTLRAPAPAAATADGI
jgi:predicted DNA-binding transcriptional regulator YafY